MREKEKIITLLEKAYYLAMQKTGGFSDHFLIIDDFQEALKNSIQKIKNEEYQVIDDLIAWFEPTYDWDDFVGDVELGNEIYSVLNQIKKGNWFCP